MFFKNLWLGDSEARGLLGGAEFVDAVVDEVRGALEHVWCDEAGADRGLGAEHVEEPERRVRVGHEPLRAALHREVELGFGLARL